MTREMLSAEEQLMQFITGKWLSKPLYIAAELGIADLLSNGPKSIDELARKSATHSPFLYRIMRALASVGIFTESSDGTFDLTPIATLLQSGFMRSVVIMFNAQWNDSAYTCLLECMRSGRNPFETAHRQPVMKWLEQNQEAAKIFNEANSFKAATSHGAIIEAYDFNGIELLADIGGGTGALMIEVLKAHPQMSGLIADVPSVVKEAEEKIKEKNLEGRCKVASCDFFTSIPSGYDAYLLSNILHDWPDTQCRIILDNFYKRMKPGTKLLIVEMIVPPGNEFSVAKLLDIEMLVITGGLERTADEFKSLLNASGFNNIKIVPAKKNISVIEVLR